jgi:hypothetical protein
MIFDIKEKKGVKIGDFNWKKDNLQDYFLIAPRKDKWFTNIYEDSVKTISEFFGINKKIVKDDLIIYFWKKRETYNILSGRKSELWEIARGFEKELGLFLLDKNYYEKESNHKYFEEEFIALVKHEIIHSFYNHLAKVSRPIWFTEGVAICFSGQNSFEKMPERFSNFLDSFSGYKDSKSIYNQTGFAVMLLFQEFGKQKLLDLIKSLSTIKSQKDFNKLFKKIYGKNPTYNFFNNLLKKQK